MTADENGWGRCKPFPLFVEDALPDYRDERLQRLLAKAKAQSHRLPEQLAETRATLAQLWADQERIDRDTEALRLRLVAAGALPAEKG